MPFAAPASADGEESIRLEIGGRTRLALVHLPEGLRGRKPEAPGLALVLALHGGASSAEQLRGYAGLDAIADREGFVVAYPEGVARPGLLSGRLHVWNAGRCCGYAREQGVDDVGFLVALIEALGERWAIDRARVFATGHSNGAMMVYRLAAEASEKIAGIAPVAGAMALDRFQPSRPVPVLHVHSLDDPRALYAGGLGPPFPLTRLRVQHEPVMAGLEQWARRNECVGEVREIESRQAPVERSDAGHKAVLIDLGPCRSGAPVRLWRMSGPGHPWPGEASLAYRRGWLWARSVGPPSAVIDAGEEAWRFFAGLSARQRVMRARRPDVVARRGQGSDKGTGFRP